MSVLNVGYSIHGTLALNYIFMFLLMQSL